MNSTSSPRLARCTASSERFKYKRLDVIRVWRNDPKFLFLVILSLGRSYSVKNWADVYVFGLLSDAVYSTASYGHIFVNKLTVWCQAAAVLICENTIFLLGWRKEKMSCQLEIIDNPTTTASSNLFSYVIFFCIIWQDGSLIERNWRDYYIFSCNMLASLGCKNLVVSGMSFLKQRAGWPRSMRGCCYRNKAVLRCQQQLQLSPELVQTRSDWGCRVILPLCGRILPKHGIKIRRCILYALHVTDLH